MISYKFHDLEVEVSGHANFKKIGKDIVCASVSTIIVVCANLLSKLDDGKNYNYKIDDGYFKLKIVNKNKINYEILLNIYDHLKELEKDYPKFIREVKKWLS